MVLKKFIVEYHCDYWDINNSMEVLAADLMTAKNIANFTLANNRCHILKVYEKQENK